MNKSATISKCTKYRYDLRRSWDDSKGLVVFVGLNPSTADGKQDDPTIRRCIGFAKRWGYGSLCMLNLFALRTPYPQNLLTHPEPVGPENDEYLRTQCEEADLVIVAWGAHGGYLGRDEEVLPLLKAPQALGLTKAGMPRHPLYMHKESMPLPYQKS